MFLLIVIRDQTKPTEITQDTPVDLMIFKKEVDAIISAEPHHKDEDQGFLVLSEAGKFGVVPSAKNKYLPELIDKWHDPELAKFYFDRYKRQKY